MTTTDLYIAPKPGIIVNEQQAVSFIEELQAHPTAWVYVLTQVLSRPTPPEYIQWREGPSKLKLFYVDGAYAIATRAALSRIGIGSDMDVLDTKIEDDGASASALVKLTFKFFHSGMILTQSSTQWGDCPKRSGMSWGDVKKGAVTDGLKKCLSEYNWAADIYGMAPENLPTGPTEEEAHLKSVDYLLSAAAEKGIAPDELNRYCRDKWGQNLNELDQVTLTSLKRRVMSKEGLV
jgi:hypothetical protein